MSNFDKILPCPDPNCDKNGTVCLGVHDHESGELELDIHQCQFCYERGLLLDVAKAAERVDTGHWFAEGGYIPDSDWHELMKALTKLREYNDES